MRKYTVVYCRSGQCGSHHYSITEFAHVETDDLSKMLNTDERFLDGAVWFVFDGYAQEAREEPLKKYLLRKNCEYSVEILAENDDDAFFKGDDPFLDWSEAWSPIEIDEDESEMDKESPDA